MKQRPRSPRAAAGAGLRIDGSLTEGGAGIGIIARLEQGVAQTQIGLKRRGIGCILRCSGESLRCGHIVTHGSKRLAAVGKQRAALAIGTVVKGGGVGLGGSAYMPKCIKALPRRWSASPIISPGVFAAPSIWAAAE